MSTNPTTERQLLERARDWIDEATTYTESPVWSPSISTEGRYLAAEIDSHLSKASPTKAPTGPRRAVTDDELQEFCDELREFCITLSFQQDDRGEERLDPLLVQASEIKRLTGALKKANEQAEHFERGWYLRGDALQSIDAISTRCIGEPVTTIEDELMRIGTKCRAALATSLMNPDRPSPWRPIATEPKDGAYVLAWRLHSTRALIVKWDGPWHDEYQDTFGDHVSSITHWMPLPEAP